MLTSRESAALDRHITGNYGEDQLRGEEEFDNNLFGYEMHRKARTLRPGAEFILDLQPNGADRICMLISIGAGSVFVDTPNGQQHWCLDTEVIPTGRIFADVHDFRKQLNQNQGEGEEMATKEKKAAKVKEGRQPTLAPFMKDRGSFKIHAEYKKDKYSATVNADGSITFEGERYTSPSSAGTAALGKDRQVDGWKFWLDAEGKNLNAMRGKASPLKAVATKPAKVKKAAADKPKKAAKPRKAAKGPKAASEPAQGQEPASESQPEVEQESELDAEIAETDAELDEETETAE